MSLSHGAALNKNIWFLTDGVNKSDCIGAYQAKGATSLTDSYKNLANISTNTLQVGVAPTWDNINGWVFNGTSYLKTGIIPNSGYSMIIRYSNLSEGVINGSMGSSNTRLGLGKLSNQHYFGGGGYIVGGGAFSVSSIDAISNISCYINGTFYANTNASWSGTNVYDLWLGGMNVMGTLTYKGNQNIQAVAFYNKSLTATQIAVITTKMQAL